jgi:DegV family protein with EDD domain
MSKTAIITDTDSSLPLDLSAKYNIQQVPILIQFGEESLRAVHDINDAQTFERIDRSGKLPTTSAPTPGHFSQAFKQALDSGSDEILCFTVSSEVSATYSAALTAAGEYPNARIQVIDTRSLALGQGMQVLAAAEALAHDASSEEAIQAASDTREHTVFYAGLATLKYLAMSGRVSHLAAGIAGIINLKPILSIQNGKLEMLEKVRTESKSWGRIFDLVADQTAGKQIERVAIMHVAAPEAAQRFETQLRARVPYAAQPLFCELTPGLSVHSGAGMVGVGMVAR